MKRQEQILSDILPKARVFADRLNAPFSRDVATADLVERGNLLRSDTRRVKRVIYVASLAVLARLETDFRSVLAKIEAQRSTLHALDDGTVFTVGLPHDPVVAAWRKARQDSRLKGAAVLGGQASGRRKKAVAAAAVAKIEARWRMPTSPENRTADLLVEAGVSRNTVNNHLGAPREALQRRWLIAQKRKEKRK